MCVCASLQACHSLHSRPSVVPQILTTQLVCTCMNGGCTSQYVAMLAVAGERTPQAAAYLMYVSLTEVGSRSGLPDGAQLFLNCFTTFRLYRWCFAGPVVSQG